MARHSTSPSTPSGSRSGSRCGSPCASAASRDPSLPRSPSTSMRSATHVRCGRPGSSPLAASSRSTRTRFPPIARTPQWRSIAPASATGQRPSSASARTTLRRSCAVMRPRARRCAPSPRATRRWACSPMLPSPSPGSRSRNWARHGVFARRDRRRRARAPRGRTRTRGRRRSNAGRPPGASVEFGRLDHDDLVGDRQLDALLARLDRIADELEQPQPPDGATGRLPARRPGDPRPAGVAERARLRRARPGSPAVHRRAS